MNTSRQAHLHSNGQTVALHARFRDTKADVLWRFASIDRSHWNVRDHTDAKQILRRYRDHSIAVLYLNTHCGGSLTAQLLREGDYQFLLRQKLVDKDGEIFVYSCTQGNQEEHRCQYHKAAETIGAAIHAPTGTSTTPWGGFGVVSEGIWIAYVPGHNVPYHGEGDLSKDTRPISHLPEY